MERPIGGLRGKLDGHQRVEVGHGLSLVAGETKPREQRQQADDMVEVAELLRSVDGRKHLIYLSEGFDSQILLGSDDADIQAGAAESAATAPKLARLYLWQSKATACTR